jgi:pSer/pThr/pTyr-binding forkhead associated (FHA) protein
LTDIYVARSHFALQWDESRRQHDLIDYRSVNGVQVNGELLTANRTLVPGDVIDVGSTRMVFEAAEPSPRPSSCASTESSRDERDWGGTNLVA